MNDYSEKWYFTRSTSGATIKVVLKDLNNDIEVSHTERALGRTGLVVESVRKNAVRALREMQEAINDEG